MDLVANKLVKMGDGAKRRGAHCDRCADTGWVELAGRNGPRLEPGELRYEEGVAPCRWCDEGVDRYTHHAGRTSFLLGDPLPPLRVDYDEGDLRFPPVAWEPGAAGVLQRKAAQTEGMAALAALTTKEVPAP